MKSFVSRVATVLIGLACCAGTARAGSIDLTAGALAFDSNLGDDRLRAGAGFDILRRGHGIDLVDGAGGTDTCFDTDQVGLFARCELP